MDCRIHAVRRAFLTLVLAALSVPAARADVVMTDGNFIVIDWSAFVDATNGATHSTTRATLDGNPDVYRRTVHIMTGNSSIVTTHIYQGAFYDPATDGAITTVDYREDRREESPPFPGALIGATPALEQGGVFFYGPDITFGDLVWTTRTLTGLVANQFTSATSTHPDFSAGGGVLRFGYARSNTNAGASAVNLRHGIDNWTVTIRNGSVGVESEVADLRTLRVLGPNPFRDAVTLQLRLASEGPVRIAIHDVAGRKVRDLVNGWRAAGTSHVVWDGKDDRGGQTGAGLYFVRFAAAGAGGAVRLLRVD